MLYLTPRVKICSFLAPSGTTYKAGYLDIPVTLIYLATPQQLSTRTH
jgi:hypothetical protein